MVGIGAVVVIAVGATVYVGRKRYKRIKYERVSKRTKSGLRVKTIGRDVRRLDNVQRKEHILAPKHNWNKVVDPKDPNRWNKIKALIYHTIANGEYEKIKVVIVECIIIMVI